LLEASLTDSCQHFFLFVGESIVGLRTYLSTSSTPSANLSEFQPILRDQKVVDAWSDERPGFAP
jgi:hypothetical protein